MSAVFLWIPALLHSWSKAVVCWHQCCPLSGLAGRDVLLCLENSAWRILPAWEQHPSSFLPLLCESIAFLKMFYFVWMFVSCWEPSSWLGSVPFLLELLDGKDLLGHLEVIPGIFPPAYSHALSGDNLYPQKWTTVCVQDLGGHWSYRLTFWAESISCWSHLFWCLAQVLPSAAWHPKGDVMCWDTDVDLVLAICEA